MACAFAPMNKPTSLSGPDAFTRELTRIDALIQSGDLRDAATALNTATQTQPRDPRAFLLGMRLAEAAGNPAGAIDMAQRAVALNPTWPVSVTEVAMLLSRLGKHAEAVAQVRRAAALAPRNPGVLQRAIEISHAAADHEAAISWIRQSLELAPRNVELRVWLSSKLIDAKQLDEASRVLDELLQDAPDNRDALHNRLLCARVAGDKERERQLADELLAADPAHETYQYWHAIAHGETPKTQPRGLVRGLFDEYAGRFDTHLAQLGYRVPETVSQMILNLHPDRRFNLLDLGCGTGLLGMFLGRIDGAIVGVDLSLEMIEKATEHGVYARFHNVDLMDALRDTPGDQYEVIASCDVLIYVGDLSEVIPNALRILKPGGHFVFTCEAAQEDEDNLVLRTSQRYAHKRSHVEALCKAAGFASLEVVDIPALRREGGEPLPGFIVVARKPD